MFYYLSEYYSLYVAYASFIDRRDWGVTGVGPTQLIERTMYSEKKGLIWVLKGSFHSLNCPF
jgi:hypothetical protein